MAIITIAWFVSKSISRIVWGIIRRNPEKARLREAEYILYGSEPAAP